MPLFAQFVLVALLPAVAYAVFRRYPSRTAILLLFIGGYLFLPRTVGFHLPLIPNYAGMVAVCYVILIGTLLFDARRFARYRPHWIDALMVAWCSAGMWSSLTNDLGFYDGLNATLNNITFWGLPYLLGRLYLNSLAAMKEAAVILVKGALIYVPFCLWEIKMSPQFHKLLYGAYAHGSGVAQARRSFGLWRPMVFMDHGLLVAMFMFSAALTALWLWQSGSVKEIWGQPIKTHAIILSVTLIAIQSANTYIYLLAGGAILLILKSWKTKIPVLLLLGLVVFYLFLATTGRFNGDGIVNWIAQNISVDRANSLGFRFKEEVKLIAHAQQQWLFGWGGWNRNRPEIYASWGGAIKTVTDSLWIITFGVNGLFGLITLYGTFLSSLILLFAWRYPPRLWFHPQVAPTIALGLCVVFFVFDSLLNAPIFPGFLLITGGVTSIVARDAEVSSQSKTPTSSAIPFPRALHPRG
ncbi:MAG: O-antigen ligase domain-containing protein [Cyanobacteria bacterium RI_101]|nr:O-antigen ligase domain-containing protein [Cyanobacteria bacterium RI_101]